MKICSILGINFISMVKRFFISSGLLILSLILLLAFVQRNDVHHQIAMAAELFGLSFSKEKVELMAPGVENNKEAFRKNRAISIDNSVPPSLQFNPIPIGFDWPVHNIVKYSDFSYTLLPGKKEELAFLSVGELGHLIKSRQITSLELTHFFLQRLRSFDSTLQCVITFTEERALQQAIRMDDEISRGIYRGPLHGIPCGVKDLLATKDYKTTWGAKPFKDQHIPYDAAVVEKLEDAGAVMIAKLTLGALAWGDVWYGGTTKNPWDITKGSSGSSAGSASAVASGALPFAIGSETLGSIVSPSTVCGATGLRPTYGRVSRYGAMALSWSMDKLGPICRNVEDCAMVLEAINGKDDRDPMTFDVPFSYEHQRPLQTIKLGYTYKDFSQDYPFKQNDSLALEVLRSLGFELIPVELPSYPDIGFILQAEAAAAFDELTTSGLDDSLVRQIRFAWPNTFREARLIPAVEYIKANRIRTLLIEEMAEFMKDIDVYIHPSWASQSLRISNLTGHPCIVLPNGFKDGLPTSISFTGRLYDEGTLMNVAKAFQSATDHHLKHPNL